MPTENLSEQEAPKIGTQKRSTKAGVREPLHVEFALNNIGQGRSVRVESVRTNDPIEMKK